MRNRRAVPGALFRRARICKQGPLTRMHECQTAAERGAIDRANAAERVRGRVAPVNQGRVSEDSWALLCRPRKDPPESLVEEQGEGGGGSWEGGRMGVGLQLIRGRGPLWGPNAATSVRPRIAGGEGGNSTPTHSSIPAQPFPSTLV